MGTNWTVQRLQPHSMQKNLWNLTLKEKIFSFQNLIRWKKHENFPYAGFLALDFSFFFLFKCIFQNIHFICFSLMFINNLYPYEYAFECVKIEKFDLKTWKKCVLSISMRNPWRVYFEKGHYMGSHYNIKIRLPNIVIVCIWFLFVDFITLTRFNSSISFWALCFFDA